MDRATIAAAVAYSGALLAYGLIRGMPPFYLLLPGALLALFPAYTRLSRTARMNFAVMLVSTGLSLLGIEGGFAIIDARSAWDTRTQIEVIQDLRDRGVSAFPPIAPKNFLRPLNAGLEVDGDRRVFPLGGLANVVTVYCNESGEWIVYDSDEHGFNNQKGLWGLDGIDIVAVGDSFTHGACVERERGAIGLLRQAYPNTLNLGYGGNGPLTVLATVKEYLPALKPRLVLWLFFEGNDISGLQFEMNIITAERQYPTYFETTFRQGLAARQADIDRSLKLFIDRKIPEKNEESEDLSGRGFFSSVLAGLKLQRLRDRVQRAVFDTRGAPVAPPGPAIEEATDEPENLSDCVYYEYDWSITVRELRDVLEDAREHIASWGGEVYFVYLPDIGRYRPARTCDQIKFESMIGFQDRVMAQAEGLGLPVVDVGRVFDNHPDPLSLWPKRGGHYNERGHRLVADTILDAIPTGTFERDLPARPYLPGKLVPIGPPVIQPGEIQAGGTVTIRWRVRNDGVWPQYGFLVLNSSAEANRTPVFSAARIGPGGVGDLTTDLYVSFPPGDYSLRVSLGDTIFSDTVTLTVLPR